MVNSTEYNELPMSPMQWNRVSSDAAEDTEKHEEDVQAMYES